MVVPKVNPTRDQLLKLMSDKDKLEERINNYGAVLTANDNVGMTGSLVDAEMFPRNDIDVYQVRQARQQIICLQNDHKELMKQIEKLMHKLHAETANDQPDLNLSHKASNIDLNASDASGASLTNAVIAKVNLVSPGSPAEDAGLRLGDDIIEFGTININNFENNLNQIGATVKHMQNQQISLKVRRENQVLNLILIPKTWSGRGFLGCNIVLPEAIER